jgi:hypothetical protein
MKRKRSLHHFLFFPAIVLLCIIPSANAAAQAGLLGDVNDDEAITIIDALLVAQYYVDMNPDNFISENADVDSTGSINIIDALLIAQFYVGIIDEFPGQSTPVPEPEQTPFPTDAREVYINEPFTLQYEETVKLASFDFYISLKDVVDSRCPTDLVCVWEGEAEVSLNCFSSVEDFGLINIKEPPAEPDSETIVDEVNDTTVYVYHIECQAVNPYPQTQDGIPLEEYVVTFVCRVAMP